MKPFWIAAALMILLASACSAQESTIILRLLNGRTGKPITDRSFNVWLGSSGNVLHDTNSSGEIKLDVAKITPPSIRVLPDHRFDCRSERDVTSGDRTEYSLDEILSKGVVGENLCGHAKSPPEPGVLIIFVRPRTFIEKWNL